MAATIVIVTDRLPHPKVRPNARVGWREKARFVAAEREYIYALCLSAIQESPKAVVTSFKGTVPSGLPFTKVQISYEYHNPRKLDGDNFIGGCKPWQDTFQVERIVRDRVQLGLGFVNDDKDISLAGEPVWVKCKKGEEKVIITLEELE